VSFFSATRGLARAGMTSAWEISSSARVRESTRQGFVRDAMVGEIEVELELKNCR